ncbi:Rid family hydrolase [Microbacterium sp. BG28]|uniref:Rid family hydrolase n=1 Tax=Microbacterium sp. BG28 TaxID=3097356 RepID=UPI0039B8ADBD
MDASAVRLIRAPRLSDAAEYAYAATAPAGTRFIFLAGACPLADDGSTVAIGDYAGQAARCVETLAEALAAAGAGLHDVVSTRVLVASARQSDLVAAWESSGTRSAIMMRRAARRDRGGRRRRGLRPAASPLRTTGRAPPSDARAPP